MERMSAPHALTLLLTACVAFSTQAQTPNVRLDVWDGKGYQPCEPSIAMDPNNPDVVVAGSILDKVENELSEKELQQLKNALVVIVCVSLLRGRK